MTLQSGNVPYDKQIFVCTNDCQGEKPSCADHQGEAVFKELRRIAKERGLHPRIRVAQAKCLGQCARGVTIMIYPGKIGDSSLFPLNLFEKRGDACSFSF